MYVSYTGRSHINVPILMPLHAAREPCMYIDRCLHVPTSTHAGQCSNVSECYNTYFSTEMGLCKKRASLCMYVCIISGIATLPLDVTVQVIESYFKCSVGEPHITNMVPTV